MWRLPGVTYLWVGARAGIGQWVTDCKVQAASTTQVPGMQGHGASYPQPSHLSMPPPGTQSHFLALIDLFGVLFGDLFWLDYPPLFEISSEMKGNLAVTFKYISWLVFTDLIINKITQYALPPGTFSACMLLSWCSCPGSTTATSWASSYLPTWVQQKTRLPGTLSARDNHPGHQFPHL